MRRTIFSFIGCLVLLGNTAEAAVLPSQSKISIHLLSSYSAGAAQIIQAHPRIIKILGTDNAMLRAAREFKAGTPEGKVVCRIYTPRQYGLAENPAASASNFWQTVLAPALVNLSSTDKALIDYVEGPNEGDSTPTWGSAQEAEWFNTFWVHLAPLIAQAGFRPLAFSISVGNPPGSLGEIQAALDRIVPALRLCQSLGGGWSYHAYSLPYGTNVAEEIWYSVRYRQYYSYFASRYPDLANLPLVLTEGGIDGVGPWSTRGDATKYQNWLQWFDRQIRQDSYCLGVTLFQIGDTGGWNGFNVEPIAPWLAAYLEAESGPPLAQWAEALPATNQVTLTFSTAIHPVTGTNLANYRLRLDGTNLAGLLSARLISDTQVQFSTVPLEAGLDYSILAVNVVRASQVPGATLFNGVVPVRVAWPLIAIGPEDTWKYNQTGVNLGTAWRGTNYNDFIWPSGAALLAYETSALPEPIRTVLRTNAGQFTFYFRKKFILPGTQATSAMLRLRHIVDDGVVYYLNGAELFRVGVAANPVTYTTPASRTVGDATYEGPFLVTPTNLMAGTNVLAAEVHQVTGTSSDVVFGLALEALLSPSQLPTAHAVVEVSLQGESIRLRWTASDMVLQYADDPAGPWTALPGQGSPWTVPATNPAQFYRLSSVLTP